MLIYGVDHFTYQDVINIINGKQKANLDKKSKTQIQNSYQNVQKIVKSDKTVYGINTGFGPLCDVKISEDDICYCAMYLSNMTLLDLDFFSECDIIDQETESITLEAVQEINNRLGLNLKKNDDFYQGLSMHFYPAIQRLKNDEQLHDNVLTDKIKTENETEYKCAMILSDVVTGAALLAASANGGFINVGANTGLMKNTEIAQKLNEEAKMLLSQTMKLHDSISQLMS